MRRHRPCCWGKGGCSIFPCALPIQPSGACGTGQSSGSCRARGSRRASNNRVGAGRAGSTRRSGRSDDGRIGAGGTGGARRTRRTCRAGRSGVSTQCVICNRHRVHALTICQHLAIHGNLKPILCVGPNVVGLKSRSTVKRPSIAPHDHSAA